MVAVASLAIEMPGSSRSTGRQEHPKGPLRTVDNTVRERVREALRAKGWEQKDLADKLDVVPATITNLLKPGPNRQIKYLPKLLRVLGLKDDLDEVTESWADLSGEDRAVIVALVRARKRAQTQLP